MLFFEYKWASARSDAELSGREPEIAGALGVWSSGF